MRDGDFQFRIERGERFAKGDILSVDLKVHQKLDPSLGTYVNKSYEIIRDPHCLTLLRVAVIISVSVISAELRLYALCLSRCRTSLSVL